MFVKIENSIIMKNIFGVKYLQRKRRFNKWGIFDAFKGKSDMEIAGDNQVDELDKGS